MIFPNSTPFIPLSFQKRGGEKAVSLNQVFKSSVGAIYL